MPSPESYKVENGKAIINGIYIDIENVTFIEPLKRGANGIVFKAFDTILQRYVAIKFWVPRVDDHRDKQKQGIAEASKVANLNHPNIVTTFSAGQLENGLFYVVMEFLPGEALKEILKNHELDLNARLKIWDNIVDALKLAHSRQIYHGDLHEGNIIISEEIAKIIDFGTSIFVRDYQDSLQRESQLIINIVKKIFPEFGMFGFNGKNINGLRPENILSACDSLVSINRCYPELVYAVKNQDDFRIKHGLFYIVSEIYECPLHKLEYIVRWLSKIGINKHYIKLLLDHVTAHLIAGIEGPWSKHSVVLKPNEQIEDKLANLRPIAIKAKELFLRGQWNL